MAREKYYWDFTVGVSYVPTGGEQIALLDVLTHQDERLQGALARLREMMLEEVRQNFLMDGERPSVNGQIVEALLFTVTVKRGVRNGS